MAYKDVTFDGHRNCQPGRHASRKTGKRVGVGIERDKHDPAGRRVDVLDEAGGKVEEVVDQFDHVTDCQGKEKTVSGALHGTLVENHQNEGVSSDADNAKDGIQDQSGDHSG